MSKILHNMVNATIYIYIYIYIYTKAKYLKKFAYIDLICSAKFFFQNFM